MTEIFIYFMLLPKGNQNQNQNGELTGEENSPTAPAVDNFIYIYLSYKSHLLQIWVEQDNVFDE